VRAHETGLFQGSIPRESQLGWTHCKRLAPWKDQHIVACGHPVRMSSQLAENALRTISFDRRSKPSADDHRDTSIREAIRAGQQGEGRALATTPDFLYPFDL
jgi:hypothetical protein